MNAVVTYLKKVYLKIFLQYVYVKSRGVNISFLKKQIMNVCPFKSFEMILTIFRLISLLWC